MELIRKEKAEQLLTKIRSVNEERDSRSLKQQGPFLNPKIKVSNTHTIHPEVLSAIKSYRNLSTSFLNLHQSHSMTPLDLLLLLW